MSKADIDDLKITNNDSTFALVDDGAVVVYNPDPDELIKFRTVASKNNSVSDIKIEITDNNTLVLHRTIGNTESLSQLSTNSDAEETIIHANIESKINFRTQDNNIYINTFSQAGWQATWLDASKTSTSYKNSLFVFAHDQRIEETTTELFLITSTTDSTIDGHLPSPKLYAFDPTNKTNGHREYKKDKDSPVIDFIFGEFDIDVSAINDSEITNDVYGQLRLNAVDENNMNTSNIYYFNPSETVSHEDDTKIKALQLMLSQP